MPLKCWQRLSKYPLHRPPCGPECNSLYSIHQVLSRSVSDLTVVTANVSGGAKGVSHMRSGTAMSSDSNGLYWNDSAGNLKAPIS